MLQFSSVQSLSCVQLFETPWIAARQASLSITNSWSALKLMSIESVMPYSHLILCLPLFLLPPTSPSIRVFSSESTLCMRWPKYYLFYENTCPQSFFYLSLDLYINWVISILYCVQIVWAVVRDHSSLDNWYQGDMQKIDEKNLNFIESMD